MPHVHRRAAAAVAVAGAFAFAGTGTAAADTTPTTPTAPVTYPGGHGHLQLGGLFKAVFDVFGAVRTQAPAVAAPVIADGVTAGTITQAEADQLTALFAGTGFGGFGVGGTGGTHAPAFSTGQRTVLHAAITAIVGQLGVIAKPVLDADVTAGSITQAQEDLILKVLSKLSSIHLPTPAAGADPTAAIQQVATRRVAAKATKKHAAPKKKAKAKAKKAGARRR
jgi:hypothetical protein